MEFTEFAFSMPTCYQLGIPNEPSPSEIQGAPYPFPPQMVPIPHPLYDCNLEPAFIRKRNERERIRVRHVNEGYARLREHLPNEPTEKRMSKVETLRAAIRYIRRLEMLLERTKDQSTCVSDKNSIGQTKWRPTTKPDMQTRQICWNLIWGTVANVPLYGRTSSCFWKKAFLVDVITQRQKKTCRYEPFFLSFDVKQAMLNFSVSSFFKRFFFKMFLKRWSKCIYYKLRYFNGCFTKCI